MLFEGFSYHDNIVQVLEYLSSKLGPKVVVNQLLERGWGVR